MIQFSVKSITNGLSDRNGKIARTLPDHFAVLVPLFATGAAVLKYRTHYGKQMNKTNSLLVSIVTIILPAPARPGATGSSSRT